MFCRISRHKSKSAWTLRHDYAARVNCSFGTFRISDVLGSYEALVALSVIGKFGSSGSFMLIYLQAMEIFPTVNRAAAMGLSTVSGNIANVFSPYIVALVRPADLFSSASSRTSACFSSQGTIYQPAPYVIFGSLAAFSCLAAAFLPESLHEPLPQTLEDSEAYGKTQRFWSLNRPSARKSPEVE